MTDTVLCTENKSEHRILLKGHIWYFYSTKKIAIKIRLCSRSGTGQGEEPVVWDISEDNEDFVFWLGDWSGGFLTSDSAPHCIQSNLALVSGSWQTGSPSPPWWLTGGSAGSGSAQHSALLTRVSPGWRQQRISTVPAPSSERERLVENDLGTHYTPFI